MAGAAVSLLDFIPSAAEELAGRVESRIQLFAERCGGGLVVLWSGGKDSTLVLLAARKVLGRRPPALTAVVPGQSNVHAIIVLARMLGYTVRWLKGRDPPPYGIVGLVARRGADFWTLLERYGLPAQMRGRKRWCCAKFKSEPLEAIRYKCALVGYKASDSTWRRLRLEREGWLARRNGRLVAAPIHDLTDDQVWLLIKHYDEGVYVHLREWYRSHPNGPDCTLCIVAGVEKFRRAAASAPPSLLARARAVFTALESRHGPATVSSARVKRILSIIDEALPARG